jgi:hypothetical protein
MRQAKCCSPATSSTLKREADGAMHRFSMEEEQGRDNRG